MRDSKPFTLEEPTIEEVARRLALIYAPVSLSRHPMFSWVLVMNDVTILGEELRRDRQVEAVRRAASVLVRLLEFVGYYTYVHEISADRNTLSDFVAKMLRQDSYTNHIPKRMLPEGPTRWILMKYPFACSKCGSEQCRCLLSPWVLENRREQPEEFFRRFQSQVDEARTNLKDRALSEFTLRSLIDHFGKIYRANYYHQEPWKIGMHLSEEMGEATTELGRLELQWRAEADGFDVNKELPEILKIAAERIGRQVANIEEKEREKHNARMLGELERLRGLFKKDPWGTYGNLVVDKFKEEVADVLSWLAAIVVKLDPDLKLFKGLPDRFVKTGRGDVSFLGCPWCHQPRCSNGCLVIHGMSREIAESVLHF